MQIVKLTQHDTPASKEKNTNMLFCSIRESISANVILLKSLVNPPLGKAAQETGYIVQLFEVE